MQALVQGLEAGGVLGCQPDGVFGGAEDPFGGQDQGARTGDSGFGVGLSVVKGLPAVLAGAIAGNTDCSTAFNRWPQPRQN